MQNRICCLWTFFFIFFSFSCALQGSTSIRMKQKVSTESQTMASLSENLSHGDPLHTHHEGKFDREYTVLFCLICILSTSKRSYSSSYWSPNHFLSLFLCILTNLHRKLDFIFHLLENFKFTDIRLYSKIKPKCSINSLFLHCTYLGPYRYFGGVWVAMPTIFWLFGQMWELLLMPDPSEKQLTWKYLMGEERKS